MLLYFEFEDRRVNADVAWSKNDGPIIVHITDPQLAKEFPTDLYFDVTEGSKVSFIIEDRNDKRLTELQEVITRRLQEFVTKW
jgi:hypothetical protein